MTAREPGASDVLTVGSTRSPSATALRASSPAPTITVGFDVLVQDVIAAMATDPVRTVADRPPTSIWIGRYERSSTGPPSPTGSVGGTGSSASPLANDGGSLAGKEPADASSTFPSPSIGSSPLSSAIEPSRPVGKLERKLS